MPPPSPLNPALEIATYEKNILISSPGPTMPSAESLVVSHEWLRIRAVAGLKQEDLPFDLSERMLDFVVSAHSYQGWFGFMVLGTPEGVEIYVSLADADTARRNLQAMFPGIRVSTALSSLPSRLGACFVSTGMVSGVPSRKQKKDAQQEHSSKPVSSDFAPLDRMIRGMRDSSWVFIVKGYALTSQLIAKEREELLDKIASLTSITRGQIQHSEQKTKTQTKSESASRSETYSGEIVNRHAEYAVELLEHELKRVETYSAMGKWQVAVYYGASRPKDSARLAALVKGIFSGPDSRPSPIRTHSSIPGALARPETDFQTYLTSEEVALMVQLPKEEVPGYAINDLARFDVDMTPTSKTALDLGVVSWEQNPSSAHYRLEPDQLARHGVVFGVTGSGKTTSVLGILYQLRQLAVPVPFLVVEPAKTEYRALLGPVHSERAKGPMPDLQVYTLGKDTISPFRLNPFEFDTSDTPGDSALLSHIDFLKAVFNAAFILYAPMPYVLETALHEVYRDKGWNFATGMNVRITNPDDWQRRNQYPIFPTLTDLYHKVEQVTRRLGYDSKIEQDVVAGLKARIGAMRLGSKGLMLDTPRGIPMEQLLSKPVVIELENIGNDDEKTFLMGLILARLYGYRRLQASEGRLPKGLQHVLVIEEAHRLLKNINVQVDTESANLRAQAVETFVNMLSEVRHYGEGVLVAEQIPVKLTPDVIKNTNLKIIHRMLAQDDREVLGTAMNMDESQIRALATLMPGQAVIYAEGEDHPLLVKIDDFKQDHHLETPRDQDIPALARRYTSLTACQVVPDFNSFGVRAIHFAGPDPTIYQSALEYINQPDFEKIWANIIFRTIFSRSTLPDALQNLRQQIAAHPGQLTAGQYNETLSMLIILGSALALERRGAQNSWSFSSVDAMRIMLTNGLLKIIRMNDLKMSAAELDRFTRNYENGLKREWGPYPGCKNCSAICVYHTEVVRLISPIEIGHFEQILSNNYSSQEAQYAVIQNLLVGIVKQWLGSNNKENEEIGYCLGLTVAELTGLNQYEQTMFAERLLAAFARK